MQDKEKSLKILDFVIDGIYKIWLIGGGWFLFVWIGDRVGMESLWDYGTPKGELSWWVMPITLLFMGLFVCFGVMIFKKVNIKCRRPLREAIEKRDEKICSLEEEIKELKFITGLQR